MVSDEALLAEFQRGSREAFEELFARYRDALHGFFRRRLDSRERAEDLTQETFLALVVEISSPDDRLYPIEARLAFAGSSRCPPALLRC